MPLHEFLSTDWQRSVANVRAAAAARRRSADAGMRAINQIAPQGGIIGVSRM